MLNLQRIKLPVSLIDITGFVAITLIGMGGIISLQSVISRWQALFLIVVLLVLYNAFRMADTVLKTQLYIAGMSALVTYLVFLFQEIFAFTILFYFLATAVMMVSTLRVGLAWVSLYIAITFIDLSLLGGWEAALSNMASIGSGYVFFGMFSYALAVTSRERDRSQKLAADLQQANQRLQDFAGQVEALTIVQERNRLAREMHDTVGHRLTVAAVQLEAAQRLIHQDTARSEQLIETVRGQVRDALAELRQSVASLRRPMESDQTWPVALHSLAKTFQEATQLDIHLSVPEEALQLSEGKRLALYRLVQEGLTNIQRHANATQVWITLEYYSDCLRLSIADNGSGFTERQKGSQPGGFGLLGLQERAAILGGKLSWVDRPEGGALICMELPVSPEERHA